MSLEQKLKEYKKAIKTYPCHELLQSYNIHTPPHYSDEDTVKNWHNKITNTIKRLLKNNNIDLVFDDSTFEVASAPGRIYKKDKDTNKFLIIKDPYNLEDDLHNSQKIKHFVKKRENALRLYSALCNVDWYKNNVMWACSWRTAGAIVAELRNKNECYLDYYCRGDEGEIHPDVQEILFELGWTYAICEPL